jgi:hypothetical protein
MKCLNTDHSRVKRLIRPQKFSQRLRCNISAARNRDMRMPGTKLRLQSNGERGFMDALVDLEQMRVRLANTDPDDFRSAFCRERSDAHNRQKKRAKLNCIESFAQREINFVGNTAEESER